MCSKDFFFGKIFATLFASEMRQRYYQVAIKIYWPRLPVPFSLTSSMQSTTFTEKYIECSIRSSKSFIKMFANSNETHNQNFVTPVYKLYTVLHELYT